ncbi:MAG: addiction module protein [Pirellulaceae bacterium]
MSRSSATHAIIDAALALPNEQRLAVLEAISQSLVDPSIDHGPVEDPSEVEASWDSEIARRLTAIESGQAVAIPAEEAERMIRGLATPSLSGRDTPRR